MINSKQLTTLKQHCIKLDIPTDLDLSNLETFRLNFLRLHLRCLSIYKKKHNKKHYKTLRDNLISTNLYNRKLIYLMSLSFYYKDRITLLESIFSRILNYYRANPLPPIDKIEGSLPDIDSIIFKPKKYASDVESYIYSLKISDFEYRFSLQQKQGNLYTTIYVYLTLYLLGNLKLNEQNKNGLKNYIDSFQSKEDGLWYDSRLENEYYNNSDWWGARHLAIHITDLLVKLDIKPKYKITYINKYTDIAYLEKWLNDVNWNDNFSHANDIDNKIMNIGTLLQYNRDYFHDENAKKSLEFLLSYLDSKINPSTGMWGNYNINKPAELSRCIQFGYHLYRLYFYDNRPIIYSNKILELVLKNQNILGGFGERIFTSACEDIDSIEFLIQLGNNKPDISVALNKALKWIKYNQNHDGGLVFRRNEKLFYGHELLEADKNESHLFATWFRTLAIVKICNYLNIEEKFKTKKGIGF